jgi:ABC-type multidrug transport system ATPase subunit
MDIHPAIEIENLCVSFDGKKVLEGFSLSMAPGDKVSLFGRSGSGKSSILRCILGFVTPLEGQIRINGEPVTGASIWRLRTHMAFVPQEPDMGIVSVRDVLNLPFSFRANKASSPDPAGIKNLFRRFLLPLDLMEKDMSTLSGGEKQRVALISALLLDRPILLLDEASSALDKESRTAVEEYLRSLSSMAVLSAAHGPEGGLLSGRVIELSGGKLE